MSVFGGPPAKGEVRAGSLGWQAGRAEPTGSLCCFLRASGSEPGLLWPSLGGSPVLGLPWHRGWRRPLLRTKA